MDDTVTLDRETFNALAQDTRVMILKRLDEHKETLTDLSEGLDLRPSTVKEHLGRLVDAGLIYAEDKGTKWKYYKLTRKGRSVLHPHETKIWVMLAVSLLAFGAMSLTLYQNLGALGTTQYTAPAAARAGGLESEERVYAAAPPEQKEKAVRAPEEKPASGDEVSALAEAHPTKIPYVQVVSAILFAAVAGACMGYLARKRRLI